MIRPLGAASVHSRRASNLQPLFKPGKHSRPRLRHRHDIFDPSSPDPRIIETRFHCQDLPRFEDSLLETRKLVDLETEAVPRAVKKSHLPAAANFGGEAAIGKVLLHLVVQVQS